MELKKYKLSEVATFEISNVDKKTKAGELSVHLCNFTDVYYNWAVTEAMEDSFMVATASDNQIKKLSLRKGQVAITKDSETRHDIGIPTYIANDFDNTVLGYHCALITPNPEMLDGRYLNAYLNSSLAKEYFANNASGSGMRYSLPVDAIKNILLYLPSIEVQREIGKIFSDIDRKIALNREINRNLEAMARQLYDYWFVQFDFPDENGRPYKSSGGKMVWNEKLKRDIPKGWKECTLHRYIGRITNGLNPRQNFVLGTGSNFYVSIRSLEGRDINWESCEKCDDSALAKINSRSQLQCGDVIFSAIGTIGRTYYIQEDPNNWNISETSFAIRPSKEIPSSFFYELLISPEIQMQADKNAMGSTMRCLVMDALCKIPTMDIPTNVVNKFNNIIAPIHNALYERNKEKRNLYKLREELLPLLMNGQVSVMPPEVNCDLSLD